MAVIQLYHAMTKHTDGIIWLKRETAWQSALDYCMENRTIYVVRGATAFLVDFLFHIANDELCLEVINIIAKPIKDNVFEEEICELICVDSYDLQEKLTPTIDLIPHFLHRYVELGETNPIGNHFVNTCKAFKHLWKLIEMTFDQKFFEKIIRCCVYVNFVNLINKLNKSKEENGVPSDNDFNEFGLKFLNLAKICILKKQYSSMMEASRLYYVLWKRLGSRVPEDIVIGNQLTKFENQVILFQILPLLSMMHRYPSCLVELQEEYILKLFNISVEHTSRICYSFRDSVGRTVDLPKMACKAINSIMSMEKELHHDRAVIVFQALCHIIKGIVYNETANLDMMVQRPCFLTALIHGLHTLVKKYRITWNESFESIAVLNCMLQMIEHVNLPPRVSFLHVFRWTK